jgi:hypothetical protein
MLQEMQTNIFTSRIKYQPILNNLTFSIDFFLVYITRHTVKPVYNEQISAVKSVC